MQIAGQSLGSFALLILVASLVVLLAYRLARLYSVGKMELARARGPGWTAVICMERVGGCIHIRVFRIGVATLYPHGSANVRHAQ